MPFCKKNYEKIKLNFVTTIPTKVTVKNPKSRIICYETKNCKSVCWHKNCILVDHCLCSSYSPYLCRYIGNLFIISHSIYKLSHSYNRQPKTMQMKRMTDLITHCNSQLKINQSKTIKFFHFYYQVLHLSIPSQLLILFLF
jgi:hypothetical protein